MQTEMNSVSWVPCCSLDWMDCFKKFNRQTLYPCCYSDMRQFLWEHDQCGEYRDRVGDLSSSQGHLSFMPQGGLYELYSNKATCDMSPCLRREARAQCLMLKLANLVLFSFLFPHLAIKVFPTVLPQLVVSCCPHPGSPVHVFPPVCLFTPTQLILRW